MSAYMAVEKLYGNNLSQEEKEAEVKRLSEDTAQLDVPSIGG